MGSFLFPNEMNSCKSSNCHLILRIYRAIALFITAVLFSYYLSGLETYLVYLTHVATVLTLAFFILSNLSYFFPFLDKAACILYQTAWAFNWTVSLAFWVYLFPRSTFGDVLQACLNHSVPLSLTLIDYALNQIAFVRIQFIFPMGGLICYLLLVLMPYTLEEEVIYTGITFKNALTYVIVVGLIVISYASLELARLKQWYTRTHSLEKPFI